MYIFHWGCRRLPALPAPSVSNMLRLAGREYETVQEMYEELKKEMLIKHERDQKRIAELKQQIAAKNEELARKEALKKEQ